MWQPKPLGHIDVVPAPPREPFSRIPVLSTVPVIIREPELLGAIAGWTPEYISRRLAGRELPISVSDPDGTFRYNPDAASGLRFEQIQAEDLAASLRKNAVGRKLCLQQIPIMRDLPELSPELVIPPYIPRQKINDINLWMASGGSKTPLHYDDMHNLFAQIEGRKKFLLFDPTQLNRLYPGPLNTRLQHLSSVNLQAPDFRRFPELKRLEYREATVMPGDLLFMPAFWWHQVSSLDATVSVNYWWRADVRDCPSPGFFRQLNMNIVLEDVPALFRTYDFDGLGAARASSAAVLALAELALMHGEVNAAAKLCGGVAVAALQEICRDHNIPTDGMVPDAVLHQIERRTTRLSGEHALVHQALTCAMAARPHHAPPAGEVADLLSRLRGSTLKWQCSDAENRC